MPRPRVPTTPDPAVTAALEDAHDLTTARHYWWTAPKKVKEAWKPLLTKRTPLTPDQLWAAYRLVGRDEVLLPMILRHPAADRRIFLDVTRHENLAPELGGQIAEHLIDNPTARRDPLVRQWIFANCVCNGYHVWRKALAHCLPDPTLDRTSLLRDAVAAAGSMEMMLEVVVAALEAHPAVVSAARPEDLAPILEHGSQDLRLRLLALLPDLSSDRSPEGLPRAATKRVRRGMRC